MKKIVTVAPDAAPPLPESVATRLAGWSAVANQYPIFSPTWFAYRMRGFKWPLVMLALVLLVVGMATVAPRPGPFAIRFYFAFIAIWLVIALALCLGRALAVLVYLRRWPARREAIGVACALAFGILVALALTPFVRTGPAQVEGRAPTAQEAADIEEARVVNLIIWLPVLVWLGGPFDLAAYFRQRGLLREAALQAQAAQYLHERNEVETQLAVLASQVEPHFLFNTLSGVRAAMLSDPARGIVMLDHLTDYLRSTIPELRSNRSRQFVTLGSQLDSARAYLGIIEARMPRLSVQVDCAAELRAAAMPPLMLISLVENAVKHGIERKKGPVRIEVGAALAGTDGERRLAVTVRDDGAGFAAASGSGIGLANIRERLRYLYGDAAALSLQNRETGGVVATITLPWRVITDKDE